MRGDKIPLRHPTDRVGGEIPLRADELDRSAQMSRGINVNPNRPPISVGRKKSCGGKKCKKVRRRGFLGIGRRVAEDWCTGTPPDRCTCLGDPCGQSARVAENNNPITYARRERPASSFTTQRREYNTFQNVKKINRNIYNI